MCCVIQKVETDNTLYDGKQLISDTYVTWSHQHTSNAKLDLIPKHVLKVPFINEQNYNIMYM